MKTNRYIIVIVCVAIIAVIACLLLSRSSETAEDFYRRYARHSEWSVSYVEQLALNEKLHVDAVCIQAHSDADWHQLCGSISAETGDSVTPQGSVIFYKAKEDKTSPRRQAMARFFVSNAKYRCICVYYIADEQQRKDFQSIGLGYLLSTPKKIN